VKRLKDLSRKKRILIVLIFISVMITGRTIDNPASNNGTKNVTPTQSSNGFPNIEGGSDGILEKILRDFYEQNSDSIWWQRIDKVVEGRLSTESTKMVYIKTDYRLGSVEDVEQGTLLCNAIISHLPRKGLSIRVDGLIEEGKILLDGTVKSKVDDEPVTTFGSSASPDGIPEWCVARTLFYDVRDGLKLRGWKQQYGYGELTVDEQRKMYEGAFMQKGPIYLN
jgi:hypothetical protein